MDGALQAVLDTMRTLGSVRHFRPDPVPLDVLCAILEAATWAPSARNAQPWFFVVVQDRQRKAAIGELYLKAWRVAQSYTEGSGADRDIDGRPGYRGMIRAVDDLAAHMSETPVIILACLDTTQLGPMAQHGNIIAPQSAYASIFPAVQNLMLAARSYGLGSTLTTVYSAVEDDIRRACKIPAHVHIAALIPLGYPSRPFRHVKRKPVDEVAFLDCWGTPLPTRGRSSK